MVSLWQVLDESTAILMSEFYKNWREKRLTKAEALRRKEEAGWVDGKLERN
jgi:CHAT domain-containing protein